MKNLGRILKNRGEEGLSLIELLVVVAIMGILATLTAVAVTGTTTSTKGAGRTNDIGVVKNADSAYAGEHDQGRHPTIDGCLPGETLSTITLVCVGGGVAEFEFEVNEADVDVDVDGDGFKTSTNVKVVPIVWNQFFGTGDLSDSSAGTDKAFIDFVDTPSHAFDLVGTKNGWADRTLARTGDSATTITSPFTTYNSGDAGDYKDCKDSISACPVWVFNASGDATSLLANSVY